MVTKKLPLDPSKFLNGMKSGMEVLLMTGTKQRLTAMVKFIGVTNTHQLMAKNSIRLKRWETSRPTLWNHMEAGPGVITMRLAQATITMQCSAIVSHYHRMFQRHVLKTARTASVTVLFITWNKWTQYIEQPISGMPCQQATLLTRLTILTASNVPGLTSRMSTHSQVRIKFACVINIISKWRSINNGKSKNTGECKWNKSESENKKLLW